VAQVIIGGTDEFNALVFGNKHPGTMQFLQRQVEQLPQISQTLTDAGRQFFSTARDLYEKYNGAEAMRLARAALRKAGSVFQKDVVRSIWEMGELQHAPSVMQRWIMANPAVRSMFHEQRCDGYADTYVDVFPGSIGRQHYDYRRVMDGVVEQEEDGFRVSMYLDPLIEGDRDLSTDEKVDILATWQVVAKLMRADGEDPTSPFGNKL
jgi:hypothetical protein